MGRKNRRFAKPPSAPPNYPCQKCGLLAKRVLYFELEPGKTTEYKLCVNCAGQVEIEIQNEWMPLVNRIIATFFAKV